MGKIAALLKSTEEKKTPLQVSLDQFGKKLSIGILIICGLLFAVSLFRATARTGSVVLDAFLFAVALAVAAIPGGAQLHRHHRAVLRHPEDGQGERDHPQAAGG